MINARGILSVIFTKAYKIGYIKNNPALDITVPFSCKGKQEEKVTVYRYHYRFMKWFQKKYSGTDYVKLHGLRHSYASIAIETGMSAKTLMSQLGHSDISMTLGLYAHAFESAKKEGAEKINEVFSKVNMA